MIRISLLVVSFGAVLLAQTPQVEQPLPASPGWNACLIHKSDAGVWYAHVDKMVPAYGAPEVIAGDDLGRLLVLTVYSGKWTPLSVTPDGQWLAPSRPADVDPRVPGRELYVAGKAGNVHRVTLVPQPFGRFALASVEIGHAAGEEFHTVLAADLLPGEPGCELLVFGISGAVYRLRPQTSGAQKSEAGFDMELLARIDGRVREALVLPGDGKQPPWIAAVSRAGQVLLLRLSGKGLEQRVLAQEPMGLGRIARRPQRGRPQAETLYVTRDDGVLLRYEQRGDDWRREVIFAGAQGLRGVAAGRFHAAPEREAVATHGYGKQVQLVSRAGHGPWQVETIFTGADQGHWLTIGELDGRNDTDELIATGFGGQVILLARPPGYGLPAAAVEAGASGAGTSVEAAAAAAGKPGTPERPWRLAVKGSEVAAQELSPLNYQGGFATKSMVYETLVRRAADGRIAPGLAASWRLDDGGRVFTFTLRAGATFHDGAPVTAEDVAVHFHRWVGLPEHAWLRSSEHIIEVRALSPRELRITLDQPWALLPDLCAINPTAIRGPGALDREGKFRRPIGSGPFAFVEVREQGRVLRYRRHRDGRPAFIDLVRLGKTAADDPIDALLRGEVDAVLGSWLVHVDPARVPALRADPRFQVVEGPGSSMTWLAFAYDTGPTSDRALRCRIAALVDRQELIAKVEHGFADASTGWAAPSVKVWPQGTPPKPEGGAIALPQPLRLAVGRALDRGAALAAALAAQLLRAGLPTEVVESAGGDGQDPPWDLRLEVTHGVPYDPHTTAVSRFTPPRNQKNAESPRWTSMDAEVSALTLRASATADEDVRQAIYRAIQARLDADCSLVPLYATRRIAVLRAGMPLPMLDHDMYALDASWLTDDAATVGKSSVGAAR